MESKNYNRSGVCTAATFAQETSCTGYIESEISGGCLWRAWSGSVCAAPSGAARIAATAHLNTTGVRA